MIDKTKFQFSFDGKQFSYSVLAVLFLTNALNFYNRTVLFALAEPIKQNFGLTDVQVGALSSAFELLYPIAAFVFSIIADRWTRKGVILLAVVIWSLFTITTGVSNSYTVLLIARMGVGLGIGGYGPSALAVLSETYPKTFRTRVFAIHDSGVIVGAVLGFVLGSLIGERFGWRASLLFAGISSLMAVGLILRIPGSALGRDEHIVINQDQTGDKKRYFSLSSITQIFSIPTMWIVYLAGVLMLFASAAISAWLPTFMIRMHGYNLSTAGVLTGLIQAVPGLLGVLIGGWLADHLLKMDKGGRLLTVGVCALVGTPFAIAAFLVSNHILFIILAAIAILFYAAYIPCIGSQIQDMTSPLMRASSFGTYLLLGHLIGNLPAPIIIGWLSDLTGSLRLGLVLAPGVAFIGGLLFLVGASQIRHPKFSSEVKT